LKFTRNSKRSFLINQLYQHETKEEEESEGGSSVEGVQEEEGGSSATSGVEEEEEEEEESESSGGEGEEEESEEEDIDVSTVFVDGDEYEAFVKFKAMQRKFEEEEEEEEVVGSEEEIEEMTAEEIELIQSLIADEEEEEDEEEGEFGEFVEQEEDMSEGGEEEEQQQEEEEKEEGMSEGEMEERLNQREEVFDDQKEEEEVMVEEEEALMGGQLEEGGETSSSSDEDTTTINSDIEEGEEGGEENLYLSYANLPIVSLKTILRSHGVDVSLMKTKDELIESLITISTSFYNLGDNEVEEEEEEEFHDCLIGDEQEQEEEEIIEGQEEEEEEEEFSLNMDEYELLCENLKKYVKDGDETMRGGGDEEELYEEIDDILEEEEDLGEEEERGENGGEVIIFNEEEEEEEEVEEEKEGDYSSEDLNQLSNYISVLEENQRNLLSSKKKRKLSYEENGQFEEESLSDFTPSHKKARRYGVEEVRRREEGEETRRNDEKFDRIMDMMKEEEEEDSSRTIHHQRQHNQPHLYVKRAPIQKPSLPPPTIHSSPPYGYTPLPSTLTKKTKRRFDVMSQSQKIFPHQHETYHKPSTTSTNNQIPNLKKRRKSLMQDQKTKFNSNQIVKVTRMDDDSRNNQKKKMITKPISFLSSIHSSSSTPSNKAYHEMVASNVVASQMLKTINLSKISSPLMDYSIQSSNSHLNNKQRTSNTEIQSQNNSVQMMETPMMIPSSSLNGKRSGKSWKEKLQSIQKNNGSSNQEEGNVQSSNLESGDEESEEEEEVDSDALFVFTNPKKSKSHSTTTPMKNETDQEFLFSPPKSNKKKRLNDGKESNKQQTPSGSFKISPNFVKTKEKNSNQQKQQVVPSIIKKVTKPKPEDAPQSLLPVGMNRFQQIANQQKNQNKNKWKCHSCLVYNEISTNVCVCCENKRDDDAVAIESAPTSQPSSSSPKKVQKKEMVSSTKSVSKFSFGVKKKSNKEEAINLKTNEEEKKSEEKKPSSSSSSETAPMSKSKFVFKSTTPSTSKKKSEEKIIPTSDGTKLPNKGEEKPKVLFLFFLYVLSISAVSLKLFYIRLLGSSFNSKRNQKRKRRRRWSVVIPNNQKKRKNLSNFN